MDGIDNFTDRMSVLLEETKVLDDEVKLTLLRAAIGKERGEYLLRDKYKLVLPLP